MKENLRALLAVLAAVVAMGTGLLPILTFSLSGRGEDDTLGRW